MKKFLVFLVLSIALVGCSDKDEKSKDNKEEKEKEVSDEITADDVVAAYEKFDELLNDTSDEDVYLLIDVQEDSEVGDGEHMRIEYIKNANGNTKTITDFEGQNITVWTVDGMLHMSSEGSEIISVEDDGSLDLGVEELLVETVPFGALFDEDMLKIYTNDITIEDGMYVIRPSETLLDYGMDAEYKIAVDGSSFEMNAVGVRFDVKIGEGVEQVTAPE